MAKDSAIAKESELDPEGLPAEDEDFKADEKDLGEVSSVSSDDSSDEEEEELDSNNKKKRKEELVDLDEDEAKALQDDLGNDIRQGKRIRRGVVEDNRDDVNSSSVKEGPSSQSDKVWKSIQTNKDEKKDDEVNAAPAEKEEEMICVKRTYRFAGELVNEEKMLPISHPEAKEYLAKQQKGIINTNSNSTSQQSRPSIGGPRRKKGGGLAAMNAAISGKPIKLNTLEKSKMDWNSFKQSSLGDQELHEMESQTKGGSSGLGSMKGYMERKDFLDRVQNRLEGQEKKS